MDVNSLENYGASRKLVEALASSGVRELYPPQAMAVEAGLLKSGASFVVAAPTASGKTLVAEMSALQAALERAGKTVYLVPLRALAREKYEDFSGKYRGAGIRIMQTTGDFDSSEPWLTDADIIIATNEKLDSLIRHRAPWLRDVSLVVADEIHLVGDPHRGPTLEVVLTRLRMMTPGLRVIALSATIPNAGEIAQWLDARLVESSWRPVPLREGVYFNRAAIFADGTVRWISADTGSDTVDLAMDTIGEGGQALVFVGTRRAAEAAAAKAAKFVRAGLSPEEARDLERLSADILSASAEQTKLGRKLADCSAQGVAFHHAGIIYQQRKLVEDAFRANRIKLVASTTTLAMGLNLPSRRVIIRDWWRYEPGFGIHSIPAIEIKQMSGRAGRPGYDEYGEALIIARNKRDERHLFEKYIKGAPEEIHSRLGSEAALRTHILASIAGLFTKNMRELIDFLSGTFFAQQSGTDYLSAVAADVLDFLETEGMIERGRAGLSATRFGRRVSELYLDPLSAVMLRDSVRMEGPKEPFPLLHMIARVPDMMSLAVRKKDREELVEMFLAHGDTLLVPEDERYPSAEMLSSLKGASVLMQWILETPEDRLTGHFGIGPGDLRTLVELADWLLYSASEIAAIFGARDAKKAIPSLMMRVAYGVKEELLELVSLRNIGRVRARSLFDAGYKNLADIREASVDGLSAVPHIGKTIAEDIKRQAQKAVAANRTLPDDNFPVRQGNV